jgi:ubiquilin
MASSTEGITVSVKTAKQKVEISIKADANVGDLKSEVLKHFSDTEYSQLCLIYSGKILKDEETLKSHNIRSGCAIHLVVRQSKGGTTPATSTTGSSSSSSSTSATTTSSNTQSTSTTSSTPPSGGTTPPMGGMPMGGMQMGGSLEQQMSQLQQQMRTNPELLGQMLNNPMMQNLMNSPDLMSSMLQSNPQMRELMERNPELNHILNNPDMMRQAMEMMRNPAMFQEMLRSHDRQLSNIESMPGGFNALARMYTEIQEPMMDVAQETLEQQNPFSALFGGSSTPPPGPTTPQGTANTNPLPNPWAASTTGSTSQPSSTTTASSSSTTTTTSTSSPLGSMFGGPGMMGGMPPGMMGDPMQLMQNPELLSQMMQTPMFQQSMQMMMSNPQLMEQMLMSNPMFAGNPNAQERVRQAMQMMQNEDFRRLLSNPDYIRAMSNITAGMQDLQRLGAGPGMFGNLGGFPPNPVSTASNSSTGSTTSTSSSSMATTTMPSSTATTTTPSSGQQDQQQQLFQAFMRTYQQQQQQQQ